MQVDRFVPGAQRNDCGIVFAHIAVTSVAVVHGELHAGGVSMALEDGTVRATSVSALLM
jgi:hypothetical protein